jgi:hypothetical protein
MDIKKASEILKRRYLTTPERVASFEAELLKSRYPLIAVYAVDWNQYSEQHYPDKGDPYVPAKGYVVGSLVEETATHVSIAGTVFDMGGVRNVVVIPKCCIIQRNSLGEVEDKP